MYIASAGGVLKALQLKVNLIRPPGHGIENFCKKFENRKPAVGIQGNHWCARSLRVCTSTFLAPGRKVLAARSAKAKRLVLCSLPSRKAWISVRWKRNTVGTKKLKQCQLFCYVFNNFTPITRPFLSKQSHTGIPLSPLFIPWHTG